MPMTLLDAHGTTGSATWDDVEKRVADATTFWLDLEAPDEGAIDRLIHVAEQVDTEREHAASVMDVYLTTANNRQNDVTKQLTAVSTVFLPLMFLTGFFGMNFPALVRAIAGWPAFAVYGLGLQLASVAVVLVVLKRRGWY